jgi:hypothetical protein
MNNRIGKIAVWTMAVLFVAACVVTWMVPREAQAATYPTKNVVLPFNGETNMTVVFRDFATGNVLNASTGACTAATTWGDGEFDSADTSEIDQHDISNDWVVIVPETTVRWLYFTYYDAAHGDVSKTTTPTGGPILYDAKTGFTHIEPETMSLYNR